MQSSVQVTIKGDALLMHRYPLDPVVAIEKKPKEEQAEIAAYRCPDTKQLFVPGVNIQRCLVGAATYSKGKGRATLQKIVAACVLVPEERCLLGVKDYAIDSRSVVIKATKGRIVRHRPRVNNWQVSFTILWDPNLLTEAQLRRVVDDAGSLVGLLDFRPECKGPFGRFIVTKWETVKMG
jgi:hypothetical protein